jgi:hypothetical protein
MNLRKNDGHAALYLAGGKLTCCMSIQLLRKKRQEDGVLALQTTVADYISSA